MDNDKKHIEEASIRLAIIQPAWGGTFPDASKTAYYARVAEAPVRLPDGREVRYSPRSFSCWESSYRRGGFEALIPKDRSDIGKSRRLDSDAASAIISMRELYPRINATQIYFKLIADGVVTKKEVSLSTVQRYIKKHSLKGASGSPEKDRKAFEEEFACGMFQADTLYGPYISENGQRRRTYCIMILDDKTRMIVGGMFFYADNAYNFQKVLKAAVSTYGIPAKLFVDNGSPYKNEQLSLICGQMGTVLIHTRIRDGASKGKVERNFRTLRNRFLNVMDPTSVVGIGHLNELLFDYIRKHNTTVHSATGMAPAQRYMADLANVRMPVSRGWLDECFLNRVRRRVRNDSTITIDQVLYDVPLEFMRAKVEIRYLPDDMEHACLYADGKKYPIRKTNKVENGKTKRAGGYEITYGGHTDV